MAIPPKTKSNSTENSGIREMTGGIIGSNATIAGTIITIIQIKFFDSVEYIRELEIKLIFILGITLLFQLFLLGVKLLPIYNNYERLLGKIVNLYTGVLIIYTLATLSWVMGFIVFNHIRNSKSFWKNLSSNEKRTLDKYIEEIEIRVQSNFEFTFNSNENYVTLSGTLEEMYSHQAYEERTTGRSYIRNLDRYLLHPEHKRVFIYGSPGSGKSTTLFKTFLTYQKQCNARESNYVPIFIHASEIAGVWKSGETSSSDYLIDFIKYIYRNDSSVDVRNFLELITTKNKINYVLIIDALDEFVDKKERGRLFDFLAQLIKHTLSSHRSLTKWIISCREEEYRAYSNILTNVDNVRLQPMDFKQVEEFLKKRLKTFNKVVDFPSDKAGKIRKSLLAIKKAEGQSEIFLSNPYYLSLWLHLLVFQPNNLEPHIPSINELHVFELRREIIKGMNQRPIQAHSVDSKLVDSTIFVLSILSFYLLRYSLQNGRSEGVSITNSNLISILKTRFMAFENYEFDPITQNRQDLYIPSILDNTVLDSRTGDNNFIILLEALRYPILGYFLNLSTNHIKLVKFLIFVASIIEQANQNRLIKFDINTMQISGFFNQRAGDYLAACYLKDSGLSQLLQESQMNFWLSRSVAIALAISENPQSILNHNNIPQDSVLETSIVDGLTLISSQQKASLKNFINRFIGHLLKEERLFGTGYDPCDPLRVLRAVQRLCLNGYSPYIDLPEQLFVKFLNHPDPGISETATIILLTYTCQVGFRRNLSQILWKHLIVKAVNFNFLFEGAGKSLSLAIKEAKK